MQVRRWVLSVFLLGIGGWVSAAGLSAERGRELERAHGVVRKYSASACSCRLSRLNSTFTDDDARVYRQMLDGVGPGEDNSDAFLDVTAKAHSAVSACGK